MNITPYQKKLRALFPSAIMTVEMCEKHIKWELKIQPSLSEKEYEDAMPAIREIFGETLIERYTEETGNHFYIYQKHSA